MKYYSLKLSFNVNLFYLFIIREPTPATRINAKERKARRAEKRKGIEAQRVKHPTESWANDALIGNEEQNGKRNKKRETVDESPTQLPWTVQSPTTCRDHTVSLYF